MSSGKIIRVDISIHVQVVDNGHMDIEVGSINRLRLKMYVGVLKTVPFRI